MYISAVRSIYLLFFIVCLSGCSSPYWVTEITLINSSSKGDPRVYTRGYMLHGSVGYCGLYLCNPTKNDLSGSEMVESEFDSGMSNKFDIVCFDDYYTNDWII